MEQSKIDQLLGKTAEEALQELNSAQIFLDNIEKTKQGLIFQRGEALLACIEAGCTQNVIAEVLGCTRQHVYHMINAHYKAKFRAKAQKESQDS